MIQIVADSFPTAGPFYVGWREFILIATLGLGSLIVDSHLLYRLACRN